MKTIRDNLIEAQALLRTREVKNHVNACELIFMDLSMIKGFDIDPISVFSYYQKYLLQRHKAVEKVGKIEKIESYFNSIIIKYRLKKVLKRSQSKQFGDGDYLLQEMFNLIRKAI